MEGKWCLFPHYRPSQPSQLESWILFLFELCTQGLYFPHYLDRDRQHDVSNCLVTHLQPGVRLIAWSKVNWIDNMAISKWLNILAFHLLEVRKHSSFPTSFLIRSYQSQSFSVWPCESGLLPQALSSLGIDQGLIPITWQGQFHLILWGGRGEIFFSWSGTSWFVYLPLFRITVTLVPSEREGLFLGWQKSWSAMGISAPGAQQGWLPSENGQPVTVRHLLIQSMARCMR